MCIHILLTFFFVFYVYVKSLTQGQMTYSRLIFFKVDYHIFEMATNSAQDQVTFSWPLSLGVDYQVMKLMGAFSCFLVYYFDIFIYYGVLAVIYTQSLSQDQMTHSQLLSLKVDYQIFKLETTSLWQVQCLSFNKVQIRSSSGPNLKPLFNLNL